MYGHGQARPSLQALVESSVKLEMEDGRVSRAVASRMAAVISGKVREDRQGGVALSEGNVTPEEYCCTCCFSENDQIGMEVGRKSQEGSEIGKAYDGKRI
jgi:hypothetical protein